MHQEQASAQVARCQRTVDSNAQPRGGRCSLDSGRRYTSYQLLLRPDGGILGRLCRNGRHRMVVIDENTTISEFKKELRMNEVYYMLNKALC